MNDEQREKFRLAGLEGRQILIEDEGGSATVAEISSRIGISSTELERLAAESNLIMIKDRWGMPRIPRWQFDGTGRVLPGLADTLRVLARDSHGSEVTPLIFFLQPHPITQGRPIDALRAGNIDSVIRAAELECEY